MILKEKFQSPYYARITYHFVLLRVLADEINCFFSKILHSDYIGTVNRVKRRV